MLLGESSERKRGAIEGGEAAGGGASGYERLKIKIRRI